jgi:5S rRNA maturation endonuclease (ribonuclease M5)
MVTDIDNKLDQFLSRLENVKQKNPDQYQAKCPAHNDKHNSFSVKKKNDKINFHCHAGCSSEAILSAMGLRWKDIYLDDGPGQHQKNKQKKKIVNTYDYRDKEGNLLYQVVRFKPKSFMQRRPAGQNKWKWGLGNVDRILYNLPAVLKAAKENKLVFLVEGEKDADNLIDLGLTATTAAMGAGNWRSNYTKSLTGADVIIIPDHDGPGIEHANKVSVKLNKNGIEANILELPDLKEKEDVTDWLNKGFDKDDLLQLAEELKMKEWEEPIELQEIEAEALPVDILPGWLSRYVNNLSMFLQAPSDMVLLIILSALSTALANKAEIEIKQGYTEPVHLWTCSILPPANRKSPVVKKISKPIWDYESQIREEIGPDRRHLLHEKEILEDVIDQKKKVASKQEEASKRDNTIARINELSDDLEILEEEIPALPRILVDDITSEKLAQVMEENQGRAAVLSAEGDIFQLMAGRYSKSANFSVFKKAWTGSEKIVDDRIGRQGTSVDKPALSLGICAQPAVIEELTDKNSFRGEGILGRFLYSIPDSPVGRRLTGSDVPALDKRTENAYINNMHKLLRTGPADKEGQSWNPHILRLSAEALQIRNKFEADVEKMLGPEGKLHHIADWGGKIVGNTVRVAGLLHIASQIDGPGIWANKKITAVSMEGAVKLGHTLIDHALKTFELLDVNPELELTKYVLKRIKKGYEMQNNGRLKERFNKEKLNRAILYKLTRDKKEIQKPNDLKIPLDNLEQLNYIKLVKRDGHKTSIIKLNPKVGTFNPLYPL